MADFDVVLRGGTVLDGSGEEPFTGDVAIAGDRIAAVGRRVPGTGRTELDVSGLAIAPGFINMLSWAAESLIEDGRSMSDILQGVTLEVMGEGTSMGPLNARMKEQRGSLGLAGRPAGDTYPLAWSTLCEFLEWLEARGVSTNIASFVGAGNLRIHEVGYDDRPATAPELDRMRALLDREMRGGAMGLASALIYPPQTSYTTAELSSLCEVVREYDGLYTSHVRNEGAGLVTAIDELISIARDTAVRSEVYHLKATGRRHWPDLGRAIDALESARAEGVTVTADLYPYDFSGTRLSVCFPPWAHEGGFVRLLERLRDPADRARIRDGIADGAWENPIHHTGPDNIRISGSRATVPPGLVGRSLAEIADERGTTTVDTAMDIVLETGQDVFTLYFTMSEENVRKVIGLPWVSFCSDAESLAAEGAVLDSAVHPRAYGAFARVLGHYVRDEGLVPLPEAIRRMTSLPAANLRLQDRGRLLVGYHADVVAFDPQAVTDHATPTDPHAYATGVQHVWVNGAAVVHGGEHTGATPGRFVRGPGAAGR